MRISRSQSSSASKNSQNQRIKLKVFSLFNRIFRHLSESFVGSDELRIWQTYDCSGNNWWYVFDPLTGRHTSVNSREKLRAWIELNYPDKTPLLGEQASLDKD